MNTNSAHPSDLRQWLNALGAQIEDKQPDPMLILKTCQLVAMASADKTKPLPSDVFCEGINDQLARMALSAMCLGVIQTVGGQMRKANS